MGSQATQLIHPTTQAETADSLLEALRGRGFTAESVPDRAAALEAVLARLPPGAEVMTASSTTLEEIGLPEALARAGHRNIRDGVGHELDPSRRRRMRRESTLAGHFLGSVNAVTADGRLVAADGSGSRIGAYAYGADHVVLVVGRNKVVPDLDSAFERIRLVAYPKEVERMRRKGFGGTALAKWLILDHEFAPGRIHVILVEEPLGY